ncbi:MAG: hypothetical protein ACRDK8_04335, partial [Solirubrobacteraceae bacterium]
MFAAGPLPTVAAQSADPWVGPARTSSLVRRCPQRYRRILDIAPRAQAPASVTSPRSLGTS